MSTLFEELDGLSVLDSLARTQNPLSDSNWVEWPAAEEGTGRLNGVGWEPGEHVPNDLFGVHWKDGFPIESANAVALVVDIDIPTSGGFPKQIYLPIGNPAKVSPGGEGESPFIFLSRFEDRLVMGIWRSVISGESPEIAKVASLRVALVVSEGWQGIFYKPEGGGWSIVDGRNWDGELMAEALEGFGGFLALSRANEPVVKNFRMGEVDKVKLAALVSEVRSPHPTVTDVEVLPNGKVNIQYELDEDADKVFIEYGKSAGVYGSKIEVEGSPGSGEHEASIHQGTLDANTKYFAILTAENGFGEASSSEFNFTTPKGELAARPVRHFGSGLAQIICDIGDQALGDFTWAALFRPDEPEHFPLLMSLVPSTYLPENEDFWTKGSILLPGSAGEGQWSPQARIHGVNANMGVTDVFDSERWYILVATRGDEEDTVRYHVFDFMAWTHTDGGAEEEAKLEPFDCTGGQAILGSVWEGNGSEKTFLNEYKGLMAAAAIWDRKMSDAEVEALATAPSVESWATPLHLWILDQEHETEQVKDEAENSADEQAGSYEEPTTTVKKANPPIALRDGEEIPEGEEGGGGEAEMSVLVGGVLVPVKFQVK
jgi:hypothetical protein